MSVDEIADLISDKVLEIELAGHLETTLAKFIKRITRKAKK